MSDPRHFTFKSEQNKNISIVSGVCCCTVDHCLYTLQFWYLFTLKQTKSSKQQGGRGH